MTDTQDTFPFYFNSISGATIQFRKNRYAFGKHLHTNLEIYLIRSGNCSMEISGQTLRCNPGDFVMIFPNVVHSFYLPDEKDCSFYHIHFSPVLFGKILPRPDAKVNLMHSLLFQCPSFHWQKASEEITHIVSSVIQLYNSGHHSNDLTSSDINLLLLRLLFLILHFYEEHPSSLNDCSSGKGGGAEYVSFALDYIDHNYMNKILLQDIADSLHISTRYLGKIFSKYMHLSLGNYINIFRINKAIDLMEKSNMTLTEISGHIGLKDSQHFSKLFFNIIGMSPSNYRRAFLRSSNRDHT